MLSSRVHAPRADTHRFPMSVLYTRNSERKQLLARIFSCSPRVVPTPTASREPTPTQTPRGSRPSCNPARPPGHSANRALEMFPPAATIRANRGYHPRLIRIHGALLETTRRVPHRTAGSLPLGTGQHLPFRRRALRNNRQRRPGSPGSRRLGNAAGLCRRAPHAPADHCVGDERRGAGGHVRPGLSGSVGDSCEPGDPGQA